MFTSEFAFRQEERIGEKRMAGGFSYNVNLQMRDPDAGNLSMIMTNRGGESEASNS